MPIHNPNKRYYRVMCRDMGCTTEHETFESSAAAKHYIKETLESFNSRPSRWDMVCPSFSIITLSQEQIDQEYHDSIAWREENMKYAYAEL
jgi:hypothetical protein